MIGQFKLYLKGNSTYANFKNNLHGIENLKLKNTFGKENLE